jgi:hypothetical protein
MNDAIAESDDSRCIGQFFVGLGEAFAQPDTCFADDLEFSFHGGTTHGVSLVGH